MSVLLETSLGTIVIDLYCVERPKCSLNFIKLCQMKQYNFCLFHSVQKNLVAQTGDPSSTGRGGFSIFSHLYGDQARYFDAERQPKIPHDRRGLVSMVDNGNGQHGSQFYITLADNLEYLDANHSVFGYIAEGAEFLDKINDVFCDKENRPFRNYRIHHTLVLDDPFENPPYLIFPDSPSHVTISLFGETGPPRIEDDEELCEANDLSPRQMAELKEEQEAKTNAQLLTLIGDLPDPSIKPPDNVLFVCKLNPITTGEDLEIIFSRFGEIKSCEVIRDKRTNVSLQYAFIEFENETDCENAFFKMDKVVIDDRRIHVDFSQSVAKEWQRFKSGTSPLALPKSQPSSSHRGGGRGYAPHHDSARDSHGRHPDLSTSRLRRNSPPSRRRDSPPTRRRDSPPPRRRDPPPSRHHLHERPARSERRLPSSSSDDDHVVKDGLDIVLSDSSESTSSSSPSPVKKKRKEKHKKHHDSKKAKKDKYHGSHEKKSRSKGSRHQ